jgi:hypothetical protein
VLNRVNIRLRSKLSDVFGRAEMEILNGLRAGKTVELPWSIPRKSS